ncbi:MAG: WecB/TagA/CpsF family glycosyltransferase [Candidatus Limivivens sp.]|nr:WecB/TagA/CpsF family glycosyltransferase [Candidatus Limivivens sp.]
MSEKIEVLGVRLDCLSTEEALERAKGFLRGDALRIIGMVTSGILLATERSEEYRQQIEQLNLSIIRDREILEAAGVTMPERLWEAEDNWFLPAFLEYLGEEKRSLVLVAETAADREKLASELKETYPQLNLVGSFSFEETAGGDTDALLNRLNGISADVILAALPSPQQENFAYLNRQKLNSRIWIGIGKNGGIQKGMKARQKFLERILEKRTFRKRVAEFSEEA